MPVQVRRSIVKDDSCVEIVSWRRVKVRKKERGKGLSQPRSKQKHSEFLGKYLGVAYQTWHYYGDRVARLSFILALTIYSFHLLLFFALTPQVPIAKEAAISENRDVS